MVELTELLTVSVDVEAPIRMGPSPDGEIVLIRFDSGTFEFVDGTTGRTLPGGTDWQTIRPDGVIEIRARYLLETDAGEQVQVLSEGIRHAAPGVLERIAAGETVGTDEYYFRTFVRMNTGAERLDHLNRRLFVARGQRTRDGVELTYYTVD